MGGPQGLKEYKRSRERQQTTGAGVVSVSSITNTLAPQQISELVLDDTVMQVQFNCVYLLY